MVDLISVIKYSCSFVLYRVNAKSIFFSTKERNESQMFTLSLKYQSTSLCTVVIFSQPLSNLVNPRLAGLIGSDSCYPHSLQLGVIYKPGYMLGTTKTTCTCRRFKFLERQDVYS